MLLNFRLTVTDSDGESDSTTATVTVNDGKDQYLIPTRDFSLHILCKFKQVCCKKEGSDHLWESANTAKRNISNEKDAHVECYLT